MVDHPQVSLAISLHAPNDEARKVSCRSIIPYPLDVLMKTLDEYVEKTNKRIFLWVHHDSRVTDKLPYAYELAWSYGRGDSDMWILYHTMLVKVSWEMICNQRRLSLSKISKSPRRTRYPFDSSIYDGWWYRCGLRSARPQSRWEKVAEVSGKRIG